MRRSGYVVLLFLTIMVAGCCFHAAECVADDDSIGDGDYLMSGGKTLEDAGGGEYLGTDGKITQAESMGGGQYLTSEGKMIEDTGCGEYLESGGETLRDMGAGDKD